MLDADEVHVWRVSLDVSTPRLALLEETLGAEERQHAQRFLRERDRAHYIARRGVLRTLLGGYLEQEPGQLKFDYNPHGKPVLAQTLLGNPPLRFNLSHSQGMALYAIAVSREVGIDLEYIRADGVSHGIAKRVFTVQELRELRSIDPKRWTEGFFRYWTRKEAYMKARGLGFSLDPRTFEVSILPDQPSELPKGLCGMSAAPRWVLQDLDMGPQVAAALAVEGHDWQLIRWEWRSS